jgi:hypothetical protein
MVVTGPVILSIPIDENGSGGKTDINSYNQISEENKSGNQKFIIFSRRFFHNILIRGIER